MYPEEVVLLGVTSVVIKKLHSLFLLFFATSKLSHAFTSFILLLYLFLFYFVLFIIIYIYMYLFILLQIPNYCLAN